MQLIASGTVLCHRKLHILLTVIKPNRWSVSAPESSASDTISIPLWTAHLIRQGVSAYFPTNATQPETCQTGILFKQPLDTRQVGGIVGHNE